ncbi:MAG: hypothetical protein QXJ24_06085 [Thermoplasmatales archaeon]
MLERGTTGFVLTLVSAPYDRVNGFLNTISATMEGESGPKYLMQIGGTIH